MQFNCIRLMYKRIQDANKHNETVIYHNNRKTVDSWHLDVIPTTKSLDKQNKKNRSSDQSERIFYLFYVRFLYVTFRCLAYIECIVYNVDRASTRHTKCILRIIL